MAFSYAIISDNLINQAVLTSEPSNPNFPVSRMGILPISRKGRVPLSSPPAKIHITFPSAVNIDTFSILHHNLSSASVLSMKAGASPNPSTVVFSPIRKKKNIVQCLDFPLNHRYWTLEITDSSNIHGFVSVGYLFFCVRTKASYGFIGSHRRRTIQSVIRKLSESEDDRVASVGSRDFCVFSFEDLSVPQHDSLDQLVEESRERAEPLLIIPDDAEQEGFLGRVEENQITRYSVGPVTSRSVVFSEEPPTTISLSL